MKIETIDRIDLRTLLCFERVALLGSFAAAGRQLDLPRAAVSRIIQQLEQHVGTALFHRTTRRVALTEDGRALLRAAGPALGDLRSALLEATRPDSAHRGTVSFSVSQAFGRRFVVPALPAFSRAHPDIRIDLSLADGLDDLVAEGRDFAIRIGDLPDSAMIARKLAQIDTVLAVPASLLAGGAPPATPRALATLPAVGFRVPGTRSLYRWQFSRGGQMHSITPETAPLTTDSIEDVARLVISGAGVAPLPTYLVADEIAAGTILPGLPDYELPSVPVHICFPGRGPRPRRVDALVAHLAEHLASVDSAGWTGRH